MKKLMLTSVAVWLCVAATTNAADLRVSPVIIEPLAGSRSSTLTLINEEEHELKVQIRVMKWANENGQDVLTPTQEVVASPPLVTLKAQEHYLVRLVRVGKSPPVGEESYRVLVDEIPDPANIKPGTVNLVLRQSIPAFFSDMPNASAQVDWNIIREGSNLFLMGRNTGNRRLRLGDLSFYLDSQRVYEQTGLVGYVLSGTELRWPIALTTVLPQNSSLHMKAVADTGPMEVSLVVPPSL